MKSFRHKAGWRLIEDDPLTAGKVIVCRFVTRKKRPGLVGLLTSCHARHLANEMENSGVWRVLENPGGVSLLLWVLWTPSSLIYNLLTPYPRDCSTMLICISPFFPSSKSLYPDFSCGLAPNRIHVPGSHPLQPLLRPFMIRGELSPRAGLPNHCLMCRIWKIANNHKLGRPQTNLTVSPLEISFLILLNNYDAPGERRRGKDWTCVALNNTFETSFRNSYNLGMARYYYSELVIMSGMYDITQIHCKFYGTKTHTLNCHFGTWSSNMCIVIARNNH